MKITSEPMQTETKPKYPYHGESTQSGNIVLFIKKDTGIFVGSISSERSLGEFDDDINESVFTPITYKTTFEGWEDETRWL